MSRRVGQIIARGDRRWLVRVYLGRDLETCRRAWHNRTIYGSLRFAQANRGPDIRSDACRWSERPRKYMLAEFETQSLETFEPVFWSARAFLYTAAEEAELPAWDR